MLNIFPSHYQNKSLLQALRMSSELETVYFSRILPSFGLWVNWIFEVSNMLRKENNAFGVSKEKWLGNKVWSNCLTLCSAPVLRRGSCSSGNYEHPLYSGTSTPHPQFPSGHCCHWLMVICWNVITWDRRSKFKSLFFHFLLSRLWDKIFLGITVCSSVKMSILVGWSQMMQYT